MQINGYRLLFLEISCSNEDKKKTYNPDANNLLHNNCFVITVYRNELNTSHYIGYSPDSLPFFYPRGHNNV